MGEVRYMRAGDNDRGQWLEGHLTSEYCADRVCDPVRKPQDVVHPPLMNTLTDEVQTALDGWLAYLTADQHSQDEIRKKRQTITAAFASMGWATVAEVTRPAVMKYRASLTGRSTKTIANHLNRVRKFFEWCELCGLVAENPVEGVRAPRVIAGQGVRAFTLEELQRLVAGSPVPRRHQYQALAYTGLRRGEARSVRWKHVDLTDRLAVMIPASAAKSRRDQVVPLCKPAFEAFSSLHHPAVMPDDPVFGTWNRKTLLRDCARAGVRLSDERGMSVGWHAFRKFFATQMIRGGLQPVQVQQLMRHRDYRTTEKSYVDKGQIQTASALFEVFGNPISSTSRTQKTDKLPPNDLTASHDVPDTPPVPGGGSGKASSGKRRGGDSNPRPRPVPNAYPLNRSPSQDTDEEVAAALAEYLLARLRRQSDGNTGNERGGRVAHDPD